MTTTPNTLLCGHRKWDSHQDCNHCLRFAVASLNDRLSAASLSHTELVYALELAAKYVAKMVADDVQTVVPPSHALRVIETALGRAKA